MKQDWHKLVIIQQQTQTQICVYNASNACAGLHTCDMTHCT